MSKTAIEKFQKRDIILNQGDYSKSLYKILSGEVALFTDYGQPGERLVEIRCSPSCFGEPMLLAEQPSPYTVVALSNAIVMHVPEDAFETFIKNDLRNAVTIMKFMARRLSQTGGWIMEADAADAPPPEPAAEAVPTLAAEAPPEPLPEADASEIPLEYEGLYPPGHRGYPGITHPEYKTHLFDKDFTCPNCRHRFPGVRIFYPKLSTVKKPEDMRYSLRIFYKDFEAEWYEVVTCPSCYFSTLDTFFAGGKTLHETRFAQQLMMARGDVWLDFTEERSLDFVFGQHYLALACARGYTDYRQITAHLWINLSWLYRSVGETALVQLAEAKAAEAYRSVYGNCLLEPAQEQHLCLTVADILYRLGDKRKAWEWARKARVNRLGKPAYANLAEQLIETVREELGGKAYSQTT